MKIFFTNNLILRNVIFFTVLFFWILYGLNKVNKANAEVHKISRSIELWESEKYNSRILSDQDYNKLQVEIKKIRNSVEEKNK